MGLRPIEILMIHGISKEKQRDESGIDIPGAGITVHRYGLGSREGLSEDTRAVPGSG